MNRNREDWQTNREAYVSGCEEYRKRIAREGELARQRDDARRQRVAELLARYLSV